MLYFDQHVRASLMEINPFVACSGLAYRSSSLESIGHRSLLPFGKPIQIQPDFSTRYEYRAATLSLSNICGCISGGVLAEYGLISEAVSPGSDFANTEMSRRQKLREQFPERVQSCWKADARNEGLGEIRGFKIRVQPG